MFSLFLAGYERLIARHPSIMLIPEVLGLRLKRTLIPSHTHAHTHTCIFVCSRGPKKAFRQS